jgi:hypothetical protein
MLSVLPERAASAMADVIAAPGVVQRTAKIGAIYTLSGT